jgi:integrase
MASIARRPDGTYRPRYRDETGREHARHFKRKVDAQRWLDEVTAAVVTGAYVDPQGGRATFGAYAADWLRLQVLRPTTAVAYERVLRTSVYPRLGELPLAKIRPSHIRSMVAWMVNDRGLAPRTVRVAVVVTSSVLKAAVLDRRIPSNPCAGVKLPEVLKARVKPLTTEQVQALLEAVPDQWWAAVVLGAGAGVRQGEMLGVTRDRVDFLRRTLLVDRQLLSLPRQAPALAPVKTKASVRSIPLPQVVTEALAGHMAAYPVHDDGLLFEPISRPAFSKLWRSAATRAGLPTSITFHDLRHYYASLLIRHGESVKVVQERLGHASASLTLDTYSHLWPDSDDRTRAAVDDVLGGSADCARTADDGP